MGNKNWMLLYAEDDVAKVLRSQPQLDRPATRAFVERLHPDAHLTSIADGTLEWANPPKNEVYAGVFPGVAVLCTGEVARDHPSRLSRRFITEARGRTLYLHAMQSVSDWFAYAIWNAGSLTRALSLAPDDGIIENLGDPLPFERPYWAGEKPLEVDEDEDPYPLPFHPLELAEDALRSLFGFNYEGDIFDDDPDLEQIVLARYRLD